MKKKTKKQTNKQKNIQHFTCGIHINVRAFEQFKQPQLKDHSILQDRIKGRSADKNVQYKKKAFKDLRGIISMSEPLDCTNC